MRVEWGRAGARSLVEAGIDVAVVVDVLSFSTTVGIAVERGMRVRPHGWRVGAEVTSDGADIVAREFDAVLAAPRGQESRQRLSLSPATMAQGPVADRVVLPSPNGSAICADLVGSGVGVIAGSLRNAPCLGHRLAQGDEVVGIVAAGERWADGSLRPAAEDLWGAGAIVNAYHLARLQRVGTLRARGPRALGLGAHSRAALDAVGHDVGMLSPEADLARRAFRAVGDRLSTVLPACTSGQELIARGYLRDVDIAAQLGAHEVVPVLVDGWFVAG